MRNSEELLEKLKRNKPKRYTEKRSEEIMNSYNIQTTIEAYCKLAYAEIYGMMLYMLNSDYDKKDIKKFIISQLKTDTQMRCDAYSVWEELIDKNN